MSLPPNPLPAPDESQSEPLTMVSENIGFPSEPVPIGSELAPPPLRFPAWSWWDVLAILGFTLFAVFVLSMLALAIAHHVPALRSMPLADLATDARIVVGAQAAAYPLVLIFIFILARSRTHERFRDVIRWNWPGASAPGYFITGSILAVVVEGLSRFLPIPKSLPMDKYFHDATSAYLLAAFGLSLAPLLEELFFRGMLYPLMRRAFGLATAIILTAAAFAAIHGAQLGYAWGPILSIFVVGVAFTIVRARTNSVAASFLMHCGYNFALFAALWVASDHFRHLEKVTG
ncbi:MAG: CPBP family intramembrane glutamic endopeptidase [Candidatus Korobacteraceae bacterium]